MTDLPRAGLRILLVEDEPAGRALVRAILARVDRPELRGIVLAEAATIAEARSVLASDPVDVVLIDVRLLDGNGLDLAAELRAQPGTVPAKVVIVSASVFRRSERVRWPPEPTPSSRSRSTRRTLLSSSCASPGRSRALVLDPQD